MVDRIGQHLPSLNWHEFTDFKKSLCRLIFATLKASWVARCWRSSVLLQKRTARWVLYLWDLVLHWFSVSDFRVFFRVSLLFSWLLLLYIYTLKVSFRIFLSFHSSGKLWKLIAVSMDWRRASRPKNSTKRSWESSKSFHWNCRTVKTQRNSLFYPRIPSFKKCTF